MFATGSGVVGLLDALQLMCMVQTTTEVYSLCWVYSGMKINNSCCTENMKFARLQLVKFYLYSRKNS